VNNLLFGLSSGVQGRSPGRVKVVRSSYKQIVRIF